MANGGRIQYTVGFNVDQSGLNQIKQSLQAIQNATTGDLINSQSLQNADKRLEEIKHTASEVQAALERSFNSDLGTLNVSKFNQELKRLDVKRIYTDFSQVGTAGQNAFRNITSQVLTTNLQLKQTNKWLDQIATTMSNTIKWGISSAIWNNMTNAVSQSFNFAKKLDTSLNDIRIVTGKSADEMERFALQANKAAKDLGQSTTAYTNASLIYYQQGLSDEETKARTETTLKAANVTGQSAAEVSEQLTAVWNGYKVNAEEAELYVDKLAAVAATTAADLEELSTGMSKVASAANIMGVDMDQLNAQLATIVSVTRQAPESVGTALKTIYARMGDIEAGLDTETTLGNYTQQMADMGFNVLDANGALRDMGDVIEEIGGKWSTLNREQQVALSQTMAGTRQYNNLLSLFDNWDMYTDALNTSAEAAGTLQNQQDIYMESMEAHLKQLSAAGEGVYNALFNAEDINPVLDTLTGVTNLFKNFIDAIGGGQGALLLLGNIATKVFNKQIASGLATIITNFQGAKNNANQLRAEMEILAQYENANIKDNRTQNLINMKRQILDYDKIITDEERNQANEIIRQTNELYKQQDLLEKKKQQVQEVAFRYTGSEIDLSNQNARETLIKDLEEDVLTFSNRLKNSMSGSRDNPSTLSASIAELQQLKNTLNETSESQQAYSNAIAKVAEQVKFQKTDINNLIDTYKLSSEQQEKLTNAVQKYDTAIQQSGRAGLKNAQAVASAKEMHEAYIQVLKELIKDGKLSISTLKGLKAEMDSINGAAETGERVFNEFTNAIDLRSRINQVISFANSLGNLSMIVSSIGRIPNILGDENLSSLEKVTQLMSIFAMTVPSAISAFNALGVAFGKTGSIADIFNTKQALNIALSKAGVEVSKENTAQMAIENIAQNASLQLLLKENKEEGENLLLEKLRNASRKEAIAILGAMSVEELMKIGLTEADALAMIQAKAQQDAWNASMLASPWTWVVLAIAAVVAGIAIYTNAVHEANKAQIEETKTKVAAIKETQKELETNKELVKQYSELTKKYEQGELTKQNLYDKTLELVSAYGTEINVLDVLAGKYDKVREAIVAARKEELQGIIDDSNSILKEYDYSYDAYLKESGVNNKIASLWDDLARSELSLVPGFANSHLQGIFGIKNGVKTENFWEDVSTVSGNTLKLDLGYAGVDQEGTFLSALEGSSAFGNYNASSNLFTGTTSEIEVTGDFSTKEGFIEAYRNIEEAYNAAMEVVGAEVYNETEADDSLYQWLQDNKEYVETLEAEQKIIKDAQAEMKAYNINFEDTNSLYDFRQQYDELYEYIRQNNPELDREGIDKQVKDLILSTSTQGDAWLVQNQAYENLVERFGESNEQIIADMVGSLSEEEFQALFSLNIDEIASLDQVESYIQRAKYLVEKEKITLKIETSQDAIDSLFEGKDLTDDQITSLQELEKEYEKLGVIQDRTSTAYLEKLIQIREELEQEKIQNQINIRNLAIEEAQDIGDLEVARTRSEDRGNYIAYNAVVETVVDPDKERELKNKLKEIAEQDYQIIVEVKADWQSDFNSVTTVMENMESVASKIGENFIVAAEDVEELNQAFPGILAGIEYLNDGTVQLNQEAVKAAMDASKREASADTLTTVEKLKNERVLLESKRDAALNIAKMAEDIAQGDSKVADAQGDINKALNTLKIENSSETAEAEGQNNQEVADSAAITAENMTQNFATAYEAMAADSQKFAEVAKHNFEVATTGQGDTISSWGDTFNTQWKATKDEDIGTVSTASSEDLSNYDDFAKIVDWQEVADYYYSLADSYDAASNENLGKQAELVARNNSFLTSMTNIGSGLGEGDSKDPDRIEYLEDERDIYHDINIEIQNITTALEALEKEQDKLFGQDFFDNLEKQFDLLDKQAQAVEKKQKIAQIEASRLRVGLAQDEVQFDKDGNITNYFDIIEKKRQALNQLIYDYNAADAATQETLKESVENAEKEFEEFQENIERYETIVTEEIPEMTAEIRELAYQQIETRVQRFDTELEVSLDMKEAEREWNEFVKNVLNDIGEKDILGNTESLLADFESYYDTAGTGEVQVNTDRVNKIMEAMRAGQNGEEGMFSTYDELGNFVYDEAAAIEALKEAQQGLMGSLTGVDEIINQINEAYINGMEQASQAFDDQIAAYESVANQIEHNMKLIELIYGEDSYEELGNYFKEQADNYVKQADFLRQEISYWENRIADAQARVNSATTGEEREQAEEELRMAQEEWQNAINDLNSTVEAAIENLQAKYANSLNQIFKEMGDKLTNGLGLEYASEEWDLINKNADRYLDTINSTYEVQKLANKYTDAINNTDSLSAQKKLNDFMEDELKMLREKDKLSQYDIDRANKKYDLMLKEIALEEARQNTSSMRLRRDSQGNYSYQFVADEDSIAQAENDLLAAQNDLYNFDKEAYKANLDEMYQAYEEYQQKMLEVAQINDPEERAERERLITEEYSELINGIVADNESIRTNLQESTFLSLAGLYTTDVENFEAMTGMNAENFAEMMGLNLSELSNLSIANIDTYTKMAEDQALILTEQMVPNFSSAMQTMIDSINGEGGFGPIAKQVWEDIKTKATEYQTALAELEEASGKNFDEISKGMDPVLEKTKELIQDNDDLIKKYEEEWTAIEGVVSRLEQLVDAYAAAEEAAEQAAAAAEEALRKAQEAIAGISNIEYNNPDGNDTPDVPKQGGTPDYPGPTGGSGGGSGGGKTFETKEDNFYGDYPYYLTTGQDIVGTVNANGNDINSDKKFPVWPSGMPTSEVQKGAWKDFALKVTGSTITGYPGFKYRKVVSYNGDIGYIEEKDIPHLNHFDTGGYTGEWGSDGRVAMLHQKEIVLNARDTENLLSAVNIVRSLGDMVKNLSAALASNLTPAAVPVGGNQGSDSIEQNVHITAEFPNVSSSSEIEQALRNLTNVASQRAFNTRR